MATVHESLDAIIDVDGAIGAAIVDYDSGVTLGTIGGESLDMELAGAGNTKFILSSLDVLQENDIDDSVEDVLVTLGNQYHLTRFSEAHDTIFTYLILNRDASNLALARRHLAEVESNLQIDADQEDGIF